MNGKITLLYVDDEPVNLMLFSTIFKKKWNVIIGYKGEEGLALLEAHPEIGIVFSDMKMPGMNGIEFITRARMKYPDKTYFIITGYDMNSEIAEALKNKIVSKFFNKPFNVKEIEQAVNEVAS